MAESPTSPPSPAGTLPRDAWNGTASMTLVGIDLGGTKTEGIVLGVDGSGLARWRVPTPRGLALAAGT